MELHISQVDTLGKCVLRTFEVVLACLSHVHPSLCHGTLQKLTIEACKSRFFRNSIGTQRLSLLRFIYGGDLLVLVLNQC